MEPASEQDFAISTVRHNLDRINEQEPELAALITLRDDEALSEAQQLDELAGRGEWPGPLYGMTLTVKDNFDVAGTRTTNGTSFAYSTDALEDCFLVERVKRAGAVVLAKANQSEYCLAVTNQNIHHGTCRNAWNRERISGGSSGGSAVSVAAGFATASIGTDSGGSIRIPASLNGLVGLRPSAGRLSNRRTGTNRIATFTAGGPIAHRATDVARLFQVMDEFDPADVTSANLPRERRPVLRPETLAGLRIGIPTNFFLDGIDREILSAVMTGLDTLVALGGRVIEINVPSSEVCQEYMTPMLTANFHALYGEYLDRPRADTDSEVVSFLEKGRSVTAREYCEAAMFRQQYRRTLEGVFDEIDVLLSPTVPSQTPLIGWKPDYEELSDFVRLTYPQAFAGVPAISIPCGFTSEGMPIGLQLTGGYWKDATLIEAAMAYQSVTDFHKARPQPVPSGTGATL
ncbi:amidase [Arthrobacter sp. MMS18-M83]|uniref:amidase n=1 Tax=Arthrobacter sp. MMS18-M83 TaxID=2996261 RepID=UPI00227A8B50|nr:amidase [Arthrobacter sp. MMS18-M83]WAH96279.1 amidase [Arthrobacter sp. MMS18-M83]